MYTENDSWIVHEGARIIDKREIAKCGLTTWESLVNALWWADYIMRNGESLEAGDAICGFHAAGLRAAEQLSLPLTIALFALPLNEFELEYDGRFEAMCDEIRAAQQEATSNSADT